MSETTLDQALTQRLDAQKEIVNIDEPLVKLVIFALGDDQFAFLGEGIHEILTKVDVFFVPGCPPSLEGVINVRGDIESVIRPHDLLHLPASRRTTPQLSCLAAATASAAAFVSTGYWMWLMYRKARSGQSPQLCQNTCGRWFSASCVSRNKQLPYSILTSCLPIMLVASDERHTR